MQLDLRLTEDATQLLALARDMRELLEHPKWKTLAKIGEGQSLNWQMILATETDVSSERKDAYYKGIIFGIRLILGTPSKIIAEADEIIRQMEKSNDRRTDNDTGLGTVTADDNG